MIKFIPLGGAGEIGASCFYLNIGGAGIILDCGMHPQKTGLEALPEFDLINDLTVDYVLISHAHQDHLSALPYLVKRHPYIRIITTPQTRALAELTLHDSVEILKKQLSEEDNLVVYSHDEIDLLIQSIEYKAYNENFVVGNVFNQSKDSIKAKFLDAGHILGSAGILLEYNEEKIFYTGDINLKNQTLLKGAVLPDSKIDVLILESTYGATDSSTLLDWSEEEQRFAKSINKVMNGGGSILIPVFSLGKMQEVISLIWKMMQRNKITNVDIYSGGLADKISRVYDYNRYVVNMIDPEFEIKAIPSKNLYDVERVESFFNNPCIVLASSGMMIEGTASFNLAKHWIRHSGSAIFTVGYMEESTPGYRIANTIKGEKIKMNNLEEDEEVKCNIENFRFSAHSRREDLLKIVKKLKPKKVILVHGEPEAIDWMSASILNIDKSIGVHEAQSGKQIIL